MKNVVGVGLFCVLLGVLICVSQVETANPFIPYVYPLYKQCDPRWGSNLMGGNDTSYDTICIQGCAMTSLSMALAAKGFFLEGEIINPASLNQWLRDNNGYTCISGNCNNLVLDAPNQLDPSKIQFISEKEKPTESVMTTWVQNLNPVAIAHVRDDSHFVLIEGYDMQQRHTFYVNDPFYNSTSYMYDEMTDLITYMIAFNTSISHF